MIFVNGETLIKRLILLVSFVTIFLATVTVPEQKGSPVHLKNEAPVVKSANTQVDKPTVKASSLKQKITNKPVKVTKKAQVPEVVKQKPAVASQQPRITGGKTEWMRAAGIPESEWWAVDSIVTRESGWNPNAVNQSSGACGLGQQLPCGKWAGEWNDPVAALIAQKQYVTERYGGYSQAVAFWNQQHWY